MTRAEVSLEAEAELEAVAPVLVEAEVVHASAEVEVAPVLVEVAHASVEVVPVLVEATIALCTPPFVTSVMQTVKCLSVQMEADPSFVAIVSKKMKAEMIVATVSNDHAQTNTVPKNVLRLLPHHARTMT